MWRQINCTLSHKLELSCLRWEHSEAGSHMYFDKSSGTSSPRFFLDSPQRTSLRPKRQTKTTASWTICGEMHYRIIRRRHCENEIKWKALHIPGVQVYRRATCAIDFATRYFALRWMCGLGSGGALSWKSVENDDCNRRLNGQNVRASTFGPRTCERCSARRRRRRHCSRTAVKCRRLREVRKVESFIRFRVLK